MKECVVTRYPLLLRACVSIVSAVFVVALVRGGLSPLTIVIAVAWSCVAVSLLSYRTETCSTEIRVRYLPFYSRRIGTQDIAYLAEGRTLVIVTPVSRVPLWGLTAGQRESVLKILPTCLNTNSARTKGDPRTNLHHHRRLTIYAGVGFVVSLVLLVPFLNHNALNKYWNGAGKYVLLLCMGFFVAFIFKAGTTYAYWSYLRDIDKVKKRDPSHRR